MRLGHAAGNIRFKERVDSSFVLAIPYEKPILLEGSVLEVGPLGP